MATPPVSQFTTLNSMSPFPPSQKIEHVPSDLHHSSTAGGTKKKKGERAVAYERLRLTTAVVGRTRQGRGRFWLMAAPEVEDEKKKKRKKPACTRCSPTCLRRLVAARKQAVFWPAHSRAKGREGRKIGLFNKERKDRFLSAAYRRGRRLRGKRKKGGGGPVLVTTFLDFEVVRKFSTLRWRRKEEKKKERGEPHRGAGGSILLTPTVRKKVLKS